MPKTKTLRYSTRSLLLLILVVAVAFRGKQWLDQRKGRLVAEKWLESLVDLNPPHEFVFRQSNRNDVTPPPEFAALNERQKLTALRDVANSADHIRYQTYALRLLVEQHSEACLPFLRDLTRCKTKEIRQLAASCLAVTCDEANRRCFQRLLDDPDARARQVGIDGLGLLGKSQREIGSTFLDSNPIIDVRQIVHPSLAITTPSQESQSPKTAKAADQLLRLMVESETEPERDSAARGIAGYAPHGYQLRVAEWGVWINALGKMELKKRIVDEIPEFVHRSAVDRSLLDQMEREVGITKPTSTSPPIPISPLT